MRSWREIRVMMKWKFPILCDSDFDFNEESKESMLHKLATKLKKTRAELEILMAELQKQ